MTVKELMEILSNVDQNQKVTLSIDYGYGETMYVEEVNVGSNNQGIVLWGDEDS